MTQTGSKQMHEFGAGSHVRVRDDASLGHCRTPVYLRGQFGTIVSIAGRFKDPERLAYHKPGLPLQTLYRVRFDQNVLWPGYSGAAGDDIEADIFEHWLEPAGAAVTEAGVEGNP